MLRNAREYFWMLKKIKKLGYNRILRLFCSCLTLWLSEHPPPGTWVPKNFLGPIGLKIGFALSKWPYFHSSYVIGVCIFFVAAVVSENDMVSFAVSIQSSHQWVWF